MWEKIIVITLLMGFYCLLSSCPTPLTSTPKDKPLQQQPVFIPRSIMSDILRSPSDLREPECLCV